MVKAATERKEAAWKEVLRARYEVAKERYIKAYKEEKRKVKRCIYQIKKEVNEQLRRKMNQNLSGDSKLFWNEVSKAEFCNRIKNRNGRGFGMIIWRIFIIVIPRSRLQSMCSFVGVQRDNYFGQ